MTVSLPVMLLALALAPACGTGSTPGEVQTIITDGLPPPPLPPGPFDLEIIDLTAEGGSAVGDVVLRFTAPGKAGQGPPDKYVVRSSRRLILADDHAGSAVVPVTTSPGSPGAAETLTLRGLEPGRTLQFTVQAVRDATTGTPSACAGGRVTGRDVPAPPTNAIRLSGPATLSTRGGTYLLTRDISATGTAFEVTAPDVTLDLGGHKVTYGTGGGKSYGVRAEYPGTAASLVVRNGAIQQATTSSQYGYGLFLRGAGNVRVSYLDVTTTGPDADGILIVECRDVRVDHCTVACLTKTVTNRHYPGCTAIWIAHSGGEVEVDQNLVTASPQWGIRVEDRDADHHGLVHHNRVLGTKALVSNGYMVALHGPNLEVYENELAGESRGIHIEGVDADGHGARIHDNRISFQDQPNPDNPTHHWAHGIKLEGARDCVVERNHVYGLADLGHGDVYALDVHVGDATGQIVRQNRFLAVSTTSSLAAHAVNWTYGAEAPAADFLAYQNVFSATDTMIYRFWDGGAGGVFRENVWLRDLSQGAGHPFRFEYFFNGDTIPSPAHRFLDPYPDTVTRTVEQRAGAGTYDTSRESTLKVLVTKGSDALEGATVAVKNAVGATVLTRTTNADGLATGIVLDTKITNGPTHEERGPHTVTVTLDGVGTWTGELELASRTAMAIDLGAATGAVDTLPPTAPTEVVTHGLSSGRALVTWEAAEDDVGIAAYLVLLDGQVAAITSRPGLYLGGLAAATSHVVTVQALDHGNNVGPATSGVALTTRSEDRGP